MPGPIDIVYTTIGGVIGAALTQFVTHIRDRRTARALVIERLGDVEQAFTLLRRTLPGDGPVFTESPTAGKLAALESACLVAGVPRSVLTCYVIAISDYEDAHGILQSARYSGEQVGRIVNDNIVAYRESPTKDETLATLKKLQQAIRTIEEHVNEIDAPAFRIHDAALRLLSRSLWHPLLIQLQRRELRKLQHAADGLEKTRREIAAMVRSHESTYRQLSKYRPGLKTTENATP